MTTLVEAPSDAVELRESISLSESVGDRALFDDDGSILNIEDMQPKTEISHCAAKPVRYALEMDKGWFAQRGLKAGAKMTGLPATR